MVATGFRWLDWWHVEGSVLEYKLGLWVDFLLSGCWPFGESLLIFWVSRFSGSPSLFCQRRELGLDSTECGRSFWKGKGAEGRGNLYVFEPLHVCLMSLMKVTWPGSWRTFSLRALDTGVDVNGTLGCHWASGNQLEDLKEIKEWT